MASLSFSRHDSKVSVCFIIVLLLSWFCYAPGLNGPFMLDDFDNLSALEGGVGDWEDLKHYLKIGNAGPLGRPVSKLTFLLDDNSWPSSPENFKRTNLLIHILTGIFVFVFLRLVGMCFFNHREANWTAMAATALWLMHPMQVSTVLYVVQRMTQLSTLFVLAGVAAHVFLRLKYREPQRIQLAWMSISISVFTLLAILSKESGALLPVLIAATELTLLSSAKQSPLFIWWRRIFVYLPTFSIVAYLAYIPKWIESYSNRDFTLVERLLTQSVVLWDYVGSLFSLRVHGLGLFQDDYPVYTSIWDPKVFFGLLGILLAISCALIFRRRFPALCFGILWFFAGHLIESSTVPLELYFEHRNYLPFVGPMFSFVVLFYAGLHAVSRDLAKLYVVVFALLTIITGGVTWGYSNEWGSTSRIIPIWAAEHPDSLRAQRTFAHHVALIGMPSTALDIIDDTYKKFPHDLSLPVMSVSFSCAFDKPLRYDLTELSNRVDQHRWTDGLRPAADNLSDFIHKTSCITIASDVATLLERTKVFRGNGTNRSGAAALQVIAGNIMLRSGDADRALEFFFDVDRMVPSVDSATRIAGVFLRAGQYQSARTMLEIAIERDGSDGISEEKMKEYVEVFDVIDSQLENAAR